MKKKQRTHGDHRRAMEDVIPGATGQEREVNGERARYSMNRMAVEEKSSKSFKKEFVHMTEVRPRGLGTAEGARPRAGGA